MAIPCYASTCTVELSTDMTGKLIANANIAKFKEYTGGNKLHVGINSDTGPGLTQYNQMTDHGADGDITHDFSVQNLFDCPAWCRFQCEYHILGEGRTTSMASPCPPAGAAEIAAALCQDQYVCRSYGYLIVPVLLGNVLGVTATAPPADVGKFIQRHDVSGVWRPADAVTGVIFNDHYFGWNQELSFLLQPLQTITVTAGIHVDEKLHFDLSTATGGSLTGNQGVQIRGATSMIFPAYPVTTYP